MEQARRIFEIEALNDIFCATEETTQQFIQSLGRMYAQNPRPTRIYSLIITAMEIGYKIGYKLKRDPL